MTQPVIGQTSVFRSVRRKGRPKGGLLYPLLDGEPTRLVMEQPPGDQGKSETHAGRVL